MKKWLSLLLSLFLLVSAGAAEPLSAGAETTQYLYTLIPGSLLEGEDADVVREIMDAVRLGITLQAGADGNMVRVLLISEGEEAFSLTAEETASGEIRVACSLLGKNILSLHREQLGSFLHTLVQVLADRGVLRNENLSKADAMADRLTAVLEKALNPDTSGEKVPGIDLQTLQNTLSTGASSSEEREIPEDERDDTGAVRAVSYLLGEEKRKTLVNHYLDKLAGVPVIGSKLMDGSIRIGGQAVTDTVIREILADSPGETTLDLYMDAEEKPVRCVLHIPDLTGKFSGSPIEQVRGIELTIRRTEGENHTQTSLTTLRPEGIEGDIVTIRLDKSPAETMQPVSGKKVHNVGEMDSSEMAELIHSMGLTIAGNALNMLLSLPRCVFDMVTDRFLKK